MYVAVFIQDTRGPYSNCQDRPQSYDFIGAFSIWNVIEVFKTCFKARDNYARPILMLLITAMLFNLSTICKFIIAMLNFDECQGEGFANKWPFLN